MKVVPLRIPIGSNVDAATGLRYASLFFNYNFAGSDDIQKLKVRGISVPRINKTGQQHEGDPVLQSNYNYAEPLIQDKLVDDIDCQNFYFFLFDKKGKLRVEGLPAQLLIENENGGNVREFSFDIDMKRSYVVTPYAYNDAGLLGIPGMVGDFYQIMLHTVN